MAQRVKNQSEIYYEAMRTRDPRFDGKFFVGVKTTGIYCRPICPARPHFRNVEFFPNALAAERSGYRPCLRCRPESAPQSPAWIGKTAMVRRAVKMLQTHDALEHNEDRFAALFGVSARHLRRVFQAEIGKTPKQLAIENRLNLARKLISETGLPFTEVAHAAGFRSLRRFNAAFKQRFKRSPRQIRRIPQAADHGIRLSLAYRPPFDFEGLLRSYRNHRMGELEWFDEHTMHRVVEWRGKVGVITIQNDPAQHRLRLDIDFPDPGAIPMIVARVRALFDLDSDPVIIANHLETDAPTKALLARFPGVRVPSGWEGFEVAVACILGQLVSVERGRALVADLIELLGEDSGLSREGKKIKLFPTPQRIAQSRLVGLKTTTARKQTLINFARAVWKKEISLEPTQAVEAFEEAVRAIRGIGPWTASYMALKVLRHTDAFPATDLILARALELHPPAVVERMSPWRGYAAALFWRSYTGVLKKEPRSTK